MARVVQTSADSPLRISEIACETWPGLLGITFAPGKQQAGETADHRRDLGADLGRIVSWGATAVITLVEPRELQDLKISKLGEEVRLRRMEWFHWPIRDAAIPDAAFEASWPARSANLRSILAAGGRILIHCKGGLGRAGTITARLLVESGVDPKRAIAQVRAARKGAIETPEQEAWIARGQEARKSDPYETRRLGESFAATYMTGDWTLRQRLSALVRFVAIFERPGFKFSGFVPPKDNGGIITVGAFTSTVEATAFHDAVYGYGWVRSFDWTTWEQSERGRSLMRDAEAMSTANEDDLANVITACVRGDRFCDGFLNDAYENGLLTRIVRRAEALLRQLELSFGHSASAG